MLEAISFGHQEIKRIGVIEGIQRKSVNPDGNHLFRPDPALVEQVNSGKMVICENAKTSRQADVDQVKEEAKLHFARRAKSMMRRPSQ